MKKALLIVAIIIVVLALVVVGVTGRIGMANNVDVGLAAGAGAVDDICQHRQLFGLQGPGVEVEIDREIGSRSRSRGSVTS